MWLTGVGQADFDLRDVWPPVCGENGRKMPGRV